MRAVALGALATATILSPAAHAADLPTCPASILRSSAPITTEPGVFPDVGDRSAEVGQIMMYRGPIGRYPAEINLERGARYDGATLRSSSDRVQVPPGRYRASGVDRNDISFAVSGLKPQDGKGNVYVTGAVRLVLLRNTGRLYIFWNRSPGSVDWKVEVPVGEFSVDYCTGPTREAFRSELLYLGLAQGRLRLRYIEYARRGDRPTLSEDLEFDLATGRTIAVMGARFEVLDADNLAIRYRVISPLE